MARGQSTQRRLAWTLAIAFFVVAVVPIALFYGFDFRLSNYYGGGSCWYLKHSSGDPSRVWARNLALFGPLVGGLIAYIAVVLVAPGRLGRTRWRFAFGLPIAVLAIILLALVALLGFVFWPEC